MTMFKNLSGVLAAYPGWLIVACAGTAVVAYFLGCFNGAVVVSRYILRDDVRSHGSGNAGLTNFHRTFGGPLTAVVILSDVLKAVLAILFSMWLFGVLSTAEADLVPFGKYWAGLFCLLGHMYPCTFQFRGGKGILSGGVVAIMIDWRVALVVWGGFIILVALTRYVSLGSCWAGLSFPFATWFVFWDGVLLGLGILIGGLILWKHRGNIQRLVSGTESKFSLHKKAAEAQPKGRTAQPPSKEKPVKRPAEKRPEKKPAKQPAEVPSEVKPAETPSEEKPAKQPTEELPEEKPAEQPAEELPAEKMAEQPAKTTERPKEKAPVSPQVKKPAGTPGKGQSGSKKKKKKGKSKGGKK